ncbi:MAG: hypothetical protein V3U78_06295 [Thiotrichaceae bacterium]
MATISPLSPTAPSTSPKSNKKKSANTIENNAHESNTHENSATLYLNQNGFQHLYLEYFTYLQDLEITDISYLYHQGLKYNLKHSHFNVEVLRYVKTDIRMHAQQIRNQVDNCKSTLHKHLTKEATDLQSALCDYLKQQKHSNDQEGENTPLNDLEWKFLNQLDTQPNDVLTEFNLAWIYFHLFEDYQAANTYLNQVIDRCILEDSPLAQIALRYLGMTYYLMGDSTNATKALQRSASLDQTNNLYYLYEIAQQLIQTDNKDAAISHIKALIKHSPLYYIHIQSDPFFADIPEVDALLSRFHAAKLEAIKETTYKKWKGSKIMQQEFPAEFDHHKLFNSTYDEHLTLLAHQPYPLLCRTETISDKFLSNLQSKTQSKLNIINKQFIQHIHAEQKKWKMVNLAGVSLVYVAVLLTLASIFLFIGGDLLGLTSNGQSINWGHLVPRIFASVLGTGLIGILLLQFNSPKLKQLAKKKNMLVEAME